jgi:hypothetical protein
VDAVAIGGCCCTDDVNMLLTMDDDSHGRVGCECCCNIECMNGGKDGTVLVVVLAAAAVAVAVVASVEVPVVGSNGWGPHSVGYDHDLVA